MEEAASPCDSDDNCHFYKYFMDQPCGCADSSEKESTSSASDLKEPTKSMLVTGFGLRHWDSLTRALLDDEQRRQMLIARHDVGESFECDSLKSDGKSAKSSELFTPKSKSKSTVFTQESDIVSEKNLQLRYLMGLADEQVEEMVEPARDKLESIPGEVEEEVESKMTLSMRKARKYLSQHKIFDFFRFLIAHMLSELPENPIQFLIDLLDKCLLYRSGFGHPPLLFEKRHIEQLFNMMDRMKTGFIDTDQYETGMKTLGICNFDKTPPLSTSGMVPKEFFIEEAYDCLTDLFVDMVRRRGGKSTPSSLVTPPPTEIMSRVSFGGGQ